MIIIKFMNFYDASKVAAESNSTTVCCMRYDVYKHPDKATVTVHKDYFDGEGVEYHIAPEEYAVEGGRPYFDVAYVENQAGKTIDKIGPFDGLCGVKMTEVVSG